jgi:endonuclease III
MNDLTWPVLVKKVKKMIKDFPIPYVTRLSSSSKASERAFLVLISTMISLRTKDKVTEEASQRLFKLAKTSLEISTLTIKTIEKAIYPCGFYRVKARQIKATSQIIENTYHGRVPNDIDKLIAFPGVGRKTANLVLTEGFDTDGICVDVHVHRIVNRLGMIQSKVPDETELILRKELPRRYWKAINFLLVTFGQYHCKPINPNCQDCLLKDVCSFKKKSCH